MDINEIISKAKIGIDLIGGPDCWVVEGSAASNTIRITPLEQAFMTNTWCFVEGKEMPFMFLALCSSKEAAEELVVRIRTTIRDEKGGICCNSLPEYTR